MRPQTLITLLAASMLAASLGAQAAPPLPPDGVHIKVTPEMRGAGIVSSGVKPRMRSTDGLW